MMAQPQLRHGVGANRCAGFRAAHRICTSARNTSDMRPALPQCSRTAERSFESLRNCFAVPHSVAVSQAQRRRRAKR